MKSNLFIGLFLIALLSSCEGKKQPQPYDFEDSADTLGNADDSYFAPNPSDENEPSKEIEWKNGNVYSYDYTESVNLTDSIGNVREITIYKQNRPSERDVVCEPKICKWCNTSIYASNYSINEYPNLNWLRGNADMSSIFSMLGMLLNGTSYLDLENNKIRTEWVTNCNYPGPDGFCSLKCESEYRNR